MFRILLIIIVFLFFSITIEWEVIIVVKKIQEKIGVLFLFTDKESDFDMSLTYLNDKIKELRVKEYNIPIEIITDRKELLEDLSDYMTYMDTVVNFDFQDLNTYKYIVALSDHEILDKFSGILIKNNKLMDCQTMHTFFIVNSKHADEDVDASLFKEFMQTDNIITIDVFLEDLNEDLFSNYTEFDVILPFNSVERLCKYVEDISKCYNNTVELYKKWLDSDLNAFIWNVDGYIDYRSYAEVVMKSNEHFSKCNYILLEEEKNIIYIDYFYPIDPPVIDEEGKDAQVFFDHLLYYKDFDIFSFP